MLDPQDVSAVKGLAPLAEHKAHTPSDKTLRATYRASEVLVDD